MHITVFGASGGIGRHVVDLAAQRGHHVRAVYRGAQGTPPQGVLPQHTPAQAEVLTAADIFDPAFVAEAIRGADVVVSANVAWHILALAEDPAPGPQRTPVITTGTGRTARPAAPGDNGLRERRSRTVS